VLCLDFAVLKLRRRAAADLPTLIGWVPDAAALFLFSGPRLSWPLDERQLLDLERVDGLIPWVLVDDSREDVPLGHFDIDLNHTHPDGSRGAQIGRVIVDPASRGRGLGTELLRLAVEEIRGMDVAELGLYVIDGNTPAIRIYTGLGFVAEPETPRPGMTPMTLRF
jgi:ribosomal protein S18 acetylase RimI-like enzyme